jgi:NADP-dependent 3-hydroxy acid dehydrogenase YdfG
VRSLGRLDILVNAAGVIQSGGVENADTAEWRRVIGINFLATLYTCKAAIPALKAQGGGDIINVTSTAARRSGTASLGPYSTSKVAVATMTEGLRQEVGDYGIRVCNIEPGATITEVADGISDPLRRDAIRQYLNREGSLTPADVGGVVVYVISLPRHVSVPEILVRPTAELDPL